MPGEQKTFFEKFITGGLRAAVGIPEGEAIASHFHGDLSIKSVREALDKAIATSNDPKEAPRLAMLLTCILAHQNGWGGLELAGEAQGMWKQTEALHRSR